MLFPRGAYYVGDLCYVLPAPSPLWDTLCEALESGESAEVIYNGTQIWMAYTAYGDGHYYDRQGRGYGVDSGTIGLVSVTACDPEKLTSIGELGHVITFANGCEPQCSNGLFHLGHITIDTRGDDDEEGGD